MWISCTFYLMMIFFYADTKIKLGNNGKVDY